MKIISVKILGFKKSHRYVLERAVIAAQQELPQIKVVVEYVKTTPEILKYTPVFALPSMLVNEQLVCVGRFPNKADVLGWLLEAEKG